MQQLITILKDLGLSATISAALTLTIKSLFDAHQRRSADALLKWLSQDSAIEPFKDDEQALRSLLELRKSLAFEKAFGLRADAKLRNELLLFAESNQTVLQIREVMGAGQLVSIFSSSTLDNPKELKIFKKYLLTFKQAGFALMVSGYGIVMFSIITSFASGKDWRSLINPVLIGFWNGGMFCLLGYLVLRCATRGDNAARFLSWRLDEKRTLYKRHSRGSEPMT